MGMPERTRLRRAANRGGGDPAEPRDHAAQEGGGGVGEPRHQAPHQDTSRRRMRQDPTASGSATQSRAETASRPYSPAVIDGSESGPEVMPRSSQAETWRRAWIDSRSTDHRVGKAKNATMASGELSSSAPNAIPIRTNRDSIS